MLQLVTESGDASLGPDGSRVALCIVEIPKLYIDLDLIHIPDFGRGQDNWQLNHWQYTMFLTDTILDMGRYLQSANHSLINRVLNVTKPINELRTIANRHQPTMKEFIYVMSQMNKVVSRKQQLDDHDDQPKMKKKKSVNLPRARNPDTTIHVQVVQSTFHQVRYTFHQVRDMNHQVVVQSTIHQVRCTNHHQVRSTNQMMMTSRADHHLHVLVASQKKKKTSYYIVQMMIN